MPTHIARDLLTVRDVGTALGCSRTTVYRLLSSGQLRSVRFGERQRVLRRDLAAYLDSLANEVRQ
jgi:excisionase family DNA binding protein